MQVLAHMVIEFARELRKKKNTLLCGFFKQRASAEVLLFEWETPLSQKLPYFRGSRSSQCFILSYQVSFYANNFFELFSSNGVQCLEYQSLYVNAHKLWCSGQFNLRIAWLFRQGCSVGKYWRSYVTIYSKVKVTYLLMSILDSCRLVLFCSGVTSEEPQGRLNLKQIQP